MARDGACRAVKRDGQPCRSIVVLLSGFCPRHDPARRDEAHAASVAGGRGRSRIARVEKLVPSVLRPVMNTLLDALGEVHRGELDPRTATAMAALSSALVRVFSSGALEERLSELETRLATLTRRGA